MSVKSVFSSGIAMSSFALGVIASFRLEQFPCFYKILCSARNTRRLIELDQMCFFHARQCDLVDMLLVTVSQLLRYCDNGSVAAVTKQSTN